MHYVKTARMTLTRVIWAGLFVLLLAIPTIPVKADSTQAFTVASNNTGILTTTWGNQLKSWHSAGRFWQFWTDIGVPGIRFSSSVDAQTWLSPSIPPISPATTDQDVFSVWFDGVHVHLAVGAGYVRGTPNTDGTITWTATQTIPGGLSSGHPNVAVDSMGKTWIVYYNTTATYATRTSNTNGVWSDDPSFPFQLSNFGTGLVDVVQVVPLTAGKVVILYDGNSGCAISAHSRLYSGSFGSEKSVAGLCRGFDMTGIGDSAYGTIVDCDFLKYTAAGDSWSLVTSPLCAAEGTYHWSISAIPTLNKIYAFNELFASTKHVIYYVYDTLSGTWGSQVDWLDESALQSFGGDVMVSYPRMMDGVIGVAWTMLPAVVPSYRLRHAFIGALTVSCDFTWSPQPVYKGNATTFTATTNASTPTYSWSWGDSSSNTTGNPAIHTYSVIGVVNVTLIINDTVTGLLCTRIHTVTILNPPPPITVTPPPCFNIGPWLFFISMILTILSLASTGWSFMHLNIRGGVFSILAFIICISLLYVSVFVVSGC